MNRDWVKPLRFQDHLLEQHNLTHSDARYCEFTVTKRPKLNKVNTTQLTFPCLTGKHPFFFGYWLIDPYKTAAKGSVAVPFMVAITQGPRSFCWGLRRRKSGLNRRQSTPSPSDRYKGSDIEWGFWGKSGANSNSVQEHGQPCKALKGLLDLISVLIRIQQKHIL